MLIVCPNCATSYQVTPESLGETGRSVRCVTCHNLWFEEPRQLAAQAVAGSDPIDVARIRPPLNDVVAIGGVHTPASEPAEFLVPDHAATDELLSGPLPDRNAPPLAPSADAATGLPDRDAPKNIESFAAGRAAKRPQLRRRRTLSRHARPAAICALVLALVCLVAARQQVVRFLPQTASLYASIGLPVNLRGLAFENIKIDREIEDGVPLLIVEGEIVGTTGRHTEVPRLRFAVTDGDGKEIYAWTVRPSRTLLPPGETLPFRSRLASPPAEASGVSVRFFNRRDAQAGFL
jgi:predicted Zn finger-like uncharacterized protein